MLFPSDRGNDARPFLAFAVGVGELQVTLLLNDLADQIGQCFGKLPSCMSTDGTVFGIILSATHKTFMC